MKAKFIVCFLLILHSKPTSFFFFGSNNNTYEIYPTDAFIFVGDKLKLWIKSKSDKQLTISELSLEAESDQNKNFELTTVNDTHGYIEIEATEELRGRNTVYGDEPLNSVLVTIESQIKSVKDFEIVLNYAEKKLHITWTQGQTYHYPNNINITAVWNVNAKPTNRSPSCLQDINSCTIPFGFQSVIELSVSAELILPRQENYINSFSFVETESPADFKRTATITIYPLKHVKPVTPEGVTAKNVISRSSILSWSTASGIWHFASNLRYQIRASNSENSSLPIVKEEVLVFGRYSNKTISSQLSGLEPAVEYNVDVRVKPVDSGYWSDRSYITITTKEDRPDRSPLLQPTSFYVEECDDEGYRGVTSLWNKPPKQDVNGKLTNYYIDSWKRKDSIPPYSIFAVHKAPCNATFNITLLALNAVGSALKPSVLTIPSESEALKIRGELNFNVGQIKVFDPLDFANVSFSWTSQHLQDTEDVIMVIYRCEDAPFSPGPCKGDFQTTEIPFNAKKVELNIPSNIDMFGYALKTALQVTGIRWINCIYDPTQGPEKVKGVEAMRGGEVGSIAVTWEAQHCTKLDRILILKYHVTVCAESSVYVLNNEYCIVKTVDGRSKPTLYVKDLDANQRYTVIVQGESPVKKGPKSDPVSVQLMDDRQDTNDPSLEIIASIVVIIVVACVITLGAWHTKKHSRKIKAEFSNDSWDYKEMDNVATETKETSGGSSGDSGISSDSIKCEESISISQNTNENSQTVRVPNNQSAVLRPNRIPPNAAAPEIPNVLTDPVSRNSSHSHSSAIYPSSQSESPNESPSFSSAYIARDQVVHQNEIDGCSENTTASSRDDYRCLVEMGGSGPSFSSVNSRKGIMKHTEQAESTIAPSGNSSNGYRAWDQEDKGHQNVVSPSHEIDECSENTTASSSDDYRHLVEMDGPGLTVSFGNSRKGIMQHTEQAESTIAPSGNSSNGYRAWDQEDKGHQNVVSPSNEIDECSENTTASSSDDYRHLVGMIGSGLSSSSENSSNGSRACDQEDKGHQNPRPPSNEIDECSENTTASSSDNYRHLVGMDGSGLSSSSENSRKGIMKHTEQAESTIAPAGNSSNGSRACYQEDKGHQNVVSPSHEIDECSENTTASSSDDYRHLVEMDGPGPFCSSGNSSNGSRACHQEDKGHQNKEFSSYTKDGCTEDTTASSSEDYRHFDPQTEESISFDDSGEYTNSNQEETILQYLERVNLQQPSEVSQANRNGKDALISKEVKCHNQRASLPPVLREVSKDSGVQSPDSYSELTFPGPAFFILSETEPSC